MPQCAECKPPSWWTERTKLEKCLILAVILTSVFALAITSAYVASILINKKNQEEKETKMSNPDNVCMTPSCIFAANTILENMDPTVSPCDNFYDFACGNFLKKKIIPEDKEGISLFQLIIDKTMKEMKNMIEESPLKGEPKAFHLIRKFYKTCTNTDTIEKDGLNTIRSLLKDLGGWPLLEGDNWLENQFDWKELSYKLQNIGFAYNPLFKVFVGTNLKNSSRRIIYITDKAERMEASYRKRLWTVDESRKAYFQYMVDASVLLGADKNKSMKEIKDMFDFDVKIRDLSKEKGDDGEVMSVNQLQQKIPDIPWVDYINNVLAPHVKISGDEAVFVFAQAYLKSLASLLRTVSKRTLANYIMWKFVYFAAPFSNKALIEAKSKYRRVESGIVTQPARWIVCVQNYMSEGVNVGVVSKSLYIGAAALFVRKFFKNKIKQDAKEMILNIHHSLEDTIKNIDWMDAKTKKNALDKLKAMGFETAYPDELLDDKKIEEFYGDLNLDENNNYLKSFLKLNQFDIRNHYRRLRVPVISGDDWISIGMDVCTINAFYVPEQNHFHIPAAILQGLMFDSDRPHYLNYGAIGIMIGHEMTHGFDNKGSKRDKRGNLFNWWAPETKNLFLNKSQCFVEQYNKYKVPDLNLTVNGTLTLGENIADNGGIAVSYKAYQKLIKKQGADKTLPGLGYTQNQLFWISAANVWCSKARVETQQSDLRDVHSPDRFRVIGFLSNNKDFSNDFHCSSNSKMNPKGKCKLW